MNDQRKRRRSIWNTPLSAKQTASVLACLLIAGVAMTWIETMHSGSSPRRHRCMHNLKRISHAMLTYDMQYGTLPPAYIADAQGKPLHSWRVLILPFLEQEALYRQYRFDEPWDGPNNRKLIPRMPDVYHCPSSDESLGAGQTSYVVVVGKNTAFPGAQARKWGELTDGPARTLLVGETCQAKISWLEPRDLDFASMSFRINAPKEPSISSNHGGRACVSFADGHCESVQDDRSPDLVKSLLDARDGKPTDEELNEP